MLGLHPWMSAYEVWLSKTGQLPPKDQTYLMERGHRFEAAAAQWFCDETGLSTRRTGTWARDHEPWMRANPDRWTSDGHGYEGKIVGEDWAQHWRYGPAQHAMYQGLWGMAVTGLDGWYVAAAMDRAFRWWLLEREPYSAVMEEMVDRCSHWWYRHIECGHEPEVDGSESTSEALRTAFAQPTPRWRCYIDPTPLSDWAEVPGITAMRAERRRVKDQINALEREARLIENRMRAGMGPARTATEFGQPVMTRVIRTRTNVDREAAVTTAPHLLVQDQYTQLKEMK